MQCGTKPALADNSTSSDTTDKHGDIPRPPSTSSKALALSNAPDSSFATDNNPDGEMTVAPVQYAVKQSCIFSFGHIVIEAPTPAAQATESSAAAQIKNNRASDQVVSQKSVNNMNDIIHNSEKIGREKRASVFHPVSSCSPIQRSFANSLTPNRTGATTRLLRSRLLQLRP